MPDRIHIAESTMGPPLRTLCDSFLPVRWRPGLFVVHSRPCPLQPLRGPLVIAHHCLLNTSCVVPLFMMLLRSAHFHISQGLIQVINPPRNIPGLPNPLVTPSLNL